MHLEKARAAAKRMYPQAEVGVRRWRGRTVTIAREGAETVLAQVTSDRPDASIIRKGLAVLRGVLSTAANAAATESGRSLIAALALPSGT